MYAHAGVRVRPSFRPNPRRWLNNWPFKLAALVLAVMLWFFIRTDESVTGQRTFNVPLAVVGLNENEMASGVPERVAVTIYGPSARIDALRAEGVDAFLDLEDVSGDFNAPVNVFPPQGLTSVRVAPAEVIGTVQMRTSKRVPVHAARFGPSPTNAVVQSETRPAEVIVTGLSSQVERVQVAMAPVPLERDDAPVSLYAATAEGEPVEGVRLEPNQVRVSESQTNVLHTRRVPLDLTLPDVSPLTITAQSLSQPDVLLAGPKEALGALERVSASASRTPAAEPASTFTSPLRLQLPEEIYALENVSLELQLSSPQTGTGGAENAPDTSPNQNP